MDIFSFSHLKECWWNGFVDGKWIRFVIAIPMIEKLHINSKEEYNLDGVQMIQISERLQNLNELTMTRCKCPDGEIFQMLNRSQSIKKLQLNDCFSIEDLQRFKAKMDVTTGWEVTIADNSIIIET